MKEALLFLLIPIASIAQVRAQKVNADFLLKRMNNESYDIRERPPVTDERGNSGPVDVTVNFLFRRLSNFDPVSMSYDLQVTLREEWKDTRLAYNNLGVNVPTHINLQDRDAIWRPDTFFMDEISAHRHEVDKPNMLYRIFPDGSVLFSERLSLKLSCPMYLASFPFDKQVCLVQLGSYALTADDLEYNWKNVHPIQIRAGFMDTLPNFHLENYTNTDCSARTNTGKYSCLRASFTLARQFNSYALQVYNPSAMLVILSWVPFWLKPSVAHTRMVIAVIILLGLVIQAGVINSSLPSVPYVRAIDVWIGTCLSFIFASVLEHAFVSHVTNQSEQRAKTSCASTTENPSPASSLENDQLLSDAPSKTIGSRLTSFIGLDDGKKIDAKARIIFPTAFIVFAIFYWFAYARA